MAIAANYHFHKDCVYYADCIEKADKVDGHKVVKLWCPIISELKHNHTGVLNGRQFNCGEAYDKSGGQAHYPSDLHTIKTDCSCFVKYQTELSLEC